MALRGCAMVLTLFFCIAATAQNPGRGKREPVNKTTPGQRPSQVKPQLRRQTELRKIGQNQSLQRQSDRSRRQVTRLETVSRTPARYESIRDLSPDELRRHAKLHANLHAQLASGIQHGRPLRLDEENRQAVADIFGDANLLDSSRSQAKVSADRRTSLPGTNANPRARLENAIRVRRAQISELRDRAIESGDEHLFSKADRFEQKLDIFLHNQERLQNNLATVRDRIATRPFLDAEGTSDRSTTSLAEGTPFKD